MAMGGLAVSDRFSKTGLDRAQGNGWKGGRPVLLA